MTSQATMAFKSSSHAHWMAASGQWKEVEKNLENVGYTSLQSILTVFDSGINEEQAWAICYQAARSLSKIWAASKVGSVLFLFVPFALFSLFLFLSATELIRSLTIIQPPVVSSVVVVVVVVVTVQIKKWITF